MTSNITPSVQAEKTAYNRKKRPEQVRSALIASAAALAISQGLNGITVQAVAQAAGVTKGGFFHHFPHKNALLDAMFDAFLAETESEIDRHIREYGQKAGCFTRAYVLVAFSEFQHGPGGLRMPLSLAMMASPELCSRWAAWLNARLARHQHTDGLPLHQMVRLATDGAWFAQSLVKGETLRDCDALRDRLLTLVEEKCEA